ncbi:MAG: hypothetical protein ABW061_00560 [Polyangiaceae bacterium]
MSEAGEGGTSGEAGAGAAPTCSPCANGFACSDTTCKTTCTADTDCLDDHFCSSGQCRLDAVQVSIGPSHACILLADRTVSCWGKNDLSQLGTASASDSATPVQVKYLSDVQSIAVGEGITFALLNDGTVDFWGTRNTAYNATQGQYTTVASQYPTQLEGLSAVKQITAGGQGNGCAALADGSVRCWGKNDWGQLGNGTGDFSAAPVVVSGVNGATGIDMGYTHACAQTPSAVKCWGANLAYQIGSYSGTFANTPQTIVGLSGTVSKLRTGSDYACALMTNGSIECWGDNQAGQLGNNTTGLETIPVTTAAISGASELTLGNGHSCALLTGGVVRCWGANVHGQTGNGNTTGSVTTPTAVQGISGAAAVAAGSSTTCAGLSNGSVKCWGRIIGTDSVDYASVSTLG